MPSSTSICSTRSLLSEDPGGFLSFRLDLAQIASDDHLSPEVSSGGHRRVVRGNQVGEDEHLNAGGAGNGSSILDGGLVGEDARSKTRRVRHAGGPPVPLQVDLPSLTLPSSRRLDAPKA